MKWNDAISAELESIVGLRYLIIKKNRGMNWWIPLYFRGEPSIEAALIESAPDDNPIKRCLAESYNKVLKVDAAKGDGAI
jgi:hypothetical protein